MVFRNSIHPGDTIGGEAVVEAADRDRLTLGVQGRKPDGEFVPATVIDHAQRRVVTEADNLLYSRLSGHEHP